MSVLVTVCPHLPADYGTLQDALGAIIGRRRTGSDSAQITVTLCEGIHRPTTRLALGLVVARGRPVLLDPHPLSGQLNDDFAAGDTLGWWESLLTILGCDTRVGSSGRLLLSALANPSRLRYRI